MGMSVFFTLCVCSYVYVCVYKYACRCVPKYKESSEFDARVFLDTFTLLFEVESLTDLEAL